MEVLKVGPHEDNTGGNRSRHDANTDRNPGMEANTRGFYRPVDGSFKSQMFSPASETLITATDFTEFKYLMQKDL
jgi:hypothetical protein